MSVQNAKFIGSFPDYSKCPEPKVPEYAFIGRSNVGKSSLINMIANNKSLAKTSSTPGKTQMINYFTMSEDWHLVDLPGYGYAKLSKKHRASLEKMIKGYIVGRKALVNTFVLIDSRIKPQKIDLEFIDFLGANQIPFSIVFTKTDKLSDNQTQENIQLFLGELAKFWAELPPHFETSALKHIGQEELLGYIEKVNKNISLHDLQG